jgi:lambda family phage portal protein
MNPLERLIAAVAPATALRRLAARHALAYYEAGEPSRLRKFHRNRGAQNELILRGAAAIRTQARHLARNHDIARGALNTLVNNTVGAAGIGIEPQPLTRDGELHDDYARQLRDAWKTWSRTPEVTTRLPWPRLQRALARAWFRDGEVFAQILTGPVTGLRYPGPVPLALEAFESDYIPFDLNDAPRGLIQGFELNAWGRPLAIHAIRREPAQPGGVRLAGQGNTHRIPWERLLHLASLDHIGQIRGMSVFASVITRLEDIKDYEESERVAAKIAAMLTAYIKKGTPDLYTDARDPAAAPRTVALNPGTIIDDLAPGEEVGMIDSRRPNPNLITFRQGQLRAVAAGLSASYSSISRDYNGTYSAQRQELVEQWIHYAVLCDEFTGEIVQPTWEAFVRAAHLSGTIPIPPNLDPATAADALFVAQAMPWIDPIKEADAYARLLEIDAISKIEIIRRRGGNPADVLHQSAQFQRMAEQQGVTLGARPAPASRADEKPEAPEK